MAPWQITISCRVEEDDHGSARPGRAWRGWDVRPWCGFVGWRVAGRRWLASTRTARCRHDRTRPSNGRNALARRSGASTMAARGSATRPWPAVGAPTSSALLALPCARSKLTRPCAHYPPPPRLPRPKQLGGETRRIWGGCGGRKQDLRDRRTKGWGFIRSMGGGGPKRGVFRKVIPYETCDCQAWHAWLVICYEEIYIILLWKIIEKISCLYFRKVIPHIWCNFWILNYLLFT